MQEISCPCCRFAKLQRCCSVSGSRAVGPDFARGLKRYQRGVCDLCPSLLHSLGVFVSHKSIDRDPSGHLYPRKGEPSSTQIQLRLQYKDYPRIRSDLFG